MWGWKAVDRHITAGVTLDQARQLIRERGFSENVVNPGYVIFKREGTQFTFKGERFPLELVIAQADSGLFLQLRYDTFVLFDDEDLEKLADDIVEGIAGVPQL